MIMVRVNVVVNRTVVVVSEYVFYRTGRRNVSHCQQQQSYNNNNNYNNNNQFIKPFGGV